MQKFSSAINRSAVLSINVAEKLIKIQSSDIRSRLICQRVEVNCELRKFNKLIFPRDVLIRRHHSPFLHKSSPDSEFLFRM